MAHDTELHRVMRSEIKHFLPNVDVCEWHRWYAWLPIRARVLTTDKKNYRWCWLEEIWRKLAGGGLHGDAYFIYALERSPDEES